MPNRRPLFDLATQDAASLAARFASGGRVQVADLLTPASADAVHDVLANHTDWGLTWHPGQAGKPSELRGAQLRGIDPAGLDGAAAQAEVAATAGQFAFIYHRYPMVDAYLQQWMPGHPLEMLLEYINSPPLLDFVRAVTGDGRLVKADAQATLFAPGHFLTSHDDSVDVEGRRIAYVLNMTRDWRPDWGGQLIFHDADGDVAAGYLPRFNSLNLFKVPQAHSVSFVPPFAPRGRYAITGWFRDR